jgi:pimeloyl-ACP methyl ester carboxylesterase
MPVDAWAGQQACLACRKGTRRASKQGRFFNCLNNKSFKFVDLITVLFCVCDWGPWYQVMMSVTHFYLEDSGGILTNMTHSAPFHRRPILYFVKAKQKGLAIYSYHQNITGKSISCSVDSKMSAESVTKSIPLTQNFYYETSTHSYNIKWCSIGDENLEPLVFIHGTPWSSRVWTPFALSLSRKYRVYLFDRPGFGDSPEERMLDGITESSDKVVQFDSDLARQSEAFAALFKSWQADWATRKAHVIAHDNGGLVSLRAYLLHECSFASLCLVDVVAIGPFGQPLFKVVAEDPRHFEQLPKMAFEGVLEAYIRNAAFYKLSEETMQQLKSPWLRNGGQRGFVRELCQANARSTDAVETRYGEVGQRLSVKMIWGAQDNWIPVESAWRLGQALGAKEIAVIENAGHLIMFDQGAQLGVELGTWLTALSLHRQ